MLLPPTDLPVGFSSHNLLVGAQGSLVAHLENVGARNRVLDYDLLHIVDIVGHIRITGRRGERGGFVQTPWTMGVPVRIHDPQVQIVHQVLRHGGVVCGIDFRIEVPLPQG